MVGNPSALSVRIMQKPVIVVHGGAGLWRPERRRAGVLGVKEAAKAGFEILKKGGTAVDAVETAVMRMEDNKIFNAGLGSVYSIDKRIEMEASIMDGKTLNAGAAGLLTDIKNPVHLARIIMENTDHVFIVGEGAEKIAQLFGLERRDPSTEFRMKDWLELKEELKRGEIDHLPKLHKLVTSHPHLFDLGTVGAVALDENRNTAAATSTGGFSLKFPGRIGDSPLIGCGTYADNEAGACSTTGIGEVFIRLVLAKNACDLMRIGRMAQEAAEESIRLVNRRMRGMSAGLVTVSTSGQIGAAHCSQHLCWAYMTSSMKQPKGALKAKVIKEG